MKTLIIYATKHGTTEKCASILSRKLTGEVDVHNLKSGSVPDLQQYDKVIIGGSIYIGRIQKEVSEFCLRNLEVLNGKTLGLFICGMQKGDALKTQLEAAFPHQLREKAVVKESLGGEFIFKNLNFIERFIVKNVSKVDKDTSDISEESIEKFVQLMNEAK